MNTSLVAEWATGWLNKVAYLLNIMNDPSPLGALGMIRLVHQEECDRARENSRNGAYLQSVIQQVYFYLSVFAGSSCSVSGMEQTLIQNDS